MWKYDESELPMATLKIEGAYIIASWVGSIGHCMENYLEIWPAKENDNKVKIQGHINMDFSKDELKRIINTLQRVVDNGVLK